MRIKTTQKRMIHIVCQSLPLHPAPGHVHVPGRASHPFLCAVPFPTVSCRLSSWVRIRQAHSLQGQQSTRDSAEEAAIRALVLRLWKNQQCGASWELEENCILWEIAGILDSDFYHTIFTLTLQHTLSRKRDSHSRYFPKGQTEKMKTLRFRVLPSSRRWLLLLTCPLEASQSLLFPPAP